MHLLDLVAQGVSEPVKTPAGCLLPGAERFQRAVRECPIRYVLADGLARCAMEMAFADGDRLVSCLDLIRVPARSLWIEWADAARQIEGLDIAAEGTHDSASAQRAGALISASADGRSGEIRTFWSTPGNLAYCSPVTARFDLDGGRGHDDGMDPAIGKGWARITAPGEFGLDEFLGHLSFHFDEEWAAYYRAACTTPAMRREVLQGNLRACAFDAPMLLAFFLMLGARGSLPRQNIPVDRLNRARQRRGKPPLLEHVMVSAPLYSCSASGVIGSSAASRRGPRLHHVCGHLVRRGAAVFWRVPHLRGSSRLGQIRTRTVELSFAMQGAERV